MVPLWWGEWWRSNRALWTEPREIIKPLIYTLTVLMLQPRGQIWRWGITADSWRHSDETQLPVLRLTLNPFIGTEKTRTFDCFNPAPWLSEGSCGSGVLQCCATHRCTQAGDQCSPFSLFHVGKDACIVRAKEPEKAFFFPSGSSICFFLKSLSPFWKLSTCLFVWILFVWFCFSRNTDVTF